MLWLYVFLGLLLLAIWRWYYWKLPGLPSGPWGLPFFGYLPLLGRHPMVTLQRLADRYGGIFSVKLGSFDAIVLCDYKLVRKAFSDPRFLDRPIKHMPLNFIPNFSSFFMMNGQEWMDHRRFSLHVLRNLGMNKSSFNHNILEELEHFVSALEARGGKPLDCNELTTPSVSNVIYALVLGRRLDYDQPARQELDNHLLEVAKILGIITFSTFLPWLKSMLGVLGVISKYDLGYHLGMIHKYISGEVKKHEAKRDPDNPRDYIDHFLEEKENGKILSHFSMNTLVGNTQTLFGAGSGTVRTALSWVILTLAMKPHYQTRLRSEVQMVVHPDENPRPEHRTRMPFTEAFVHEILRWKTITPLGIFHSTSTVTQFEGYTLPEGIVVIPNLHACHHDPEYWGDPENFRPERFLTEDGSKLVKHEAFMPFSVGRRACPGEGLALLELFLYTASVVHHFHITPAPGTKPTFEGVTQLSHDPIYTTFCFAPLNST